MMVAVEVRGPLSTLVQARTQIVGAFNNSGAKLVSNIRILFDATAPDYVSLANAISQAVVAIQLSLSLASRAAFDALTSNLNTVKTNFPTLNFDLVYQEPATL